MVRLSLILRVVLAMPITIGFVWVLTTVLVITSMVSWPRRLVFKRPNLRPGGANITLLAEDCFNTLFLGRNQLAARSLYY